MSFLGQEEQIREFQDRFRYLYTALFIGLGLLLLRLVFLQILVGDKMYDISEKNRIRKIRIASPRGMIFDRNHRLLIDNRPSFDLEITPQYLRETKRGAEIIKTLAPLIGMKETEIESALKKRVFDPPFLPVKIKRDLSREEVAKVESWKIDMPGVDIREEIKRTNVYGDIAAHMLGYVQEVNESDIAALKKKGLAYERGDQIGRIGLEQKMESNLRGTDGEEIQEVDALGRTKLDSRKGRVLSNLGATEPTPGKNLVLTIDQDLQIAASKAFGDKSGGVVAIDPRNGQILAMVSRPSFDPTEFSRGITSGIWNQLLSNEHKPLRDKTLQEHYPPGSTFKILTALVGLEEGVIDERSTFHCSGSIKLGNRVVRCWKKEGHGNVNVSQAITKSCDVFFYRTAQKLKSVNDIAKWAFKFGLGKKTEVPLPHEVPGLIPTEEWKQKTLKQPWNPGETINVAIGQGYVLTTAVQLANLYATFANGGTLFRPYLVKQIETVDGKVLETFSPHVLGEARLKESTRKWVGKGLWDVVNDPTGTAHASRLPGMDFAGKTGTAQVVRLGKIIIKCENVRYRERDHGLFVGIAPLQDPVIAVAVVAEHACHGASGAAPVAKEVIKTYLQKINPSLYSDDAVKERLKMQGKNPQMPQVFNPDRSTENEEDVRQEDVETPFLPNSAEPRDSQEE